MNKLSLIALTLLSFAAPCLAAPGAEFVVKKVALDYPASPDIPGASGAAIQWKAQQWVRIEVTFDAVADFTDELTFNYYVLYSDRPSPDRLFVGRVNHVNIAKGPGLHSAMFISPKTLQRIAQRSSTKTFVPTNFPITQVTVTITKPGVTAPIAIGSLKPGAQGEWWSTIKQEEGFLLNKSETPFASLHWDYYEALKPAGAH